MNITEKSFLVIGGDNSEDNAAPLNTVVEHVILDSFFGLWRLGGLHGGRSCLLINEGSLGTCTVG